MFSRDIFCGKKWIFYMKNEKYVIWKIMYDIWGLIVKKDVFIFKWFFLCNIIWENCFYFCMKVVLVKRL